MSTFSHDLRVARMVWNGVPNLTDAAWVPLKAPLWISLMPSSLASLAQKLRPAARNLSRASAHEKFLNESSEDKAVNDFEMKHKTVKRDQLTRLNSNLNKELEGSQGESSSLTTSIWASATRLRCSSARRRSSF